MKLALEELALRLQLELPRAEGGPDIVEIARASGVRGGYEQDASAIRLAAIAGEEVDVRRFRFELGAAGRLVVDTAALRKVDVDATIALGNLAGRRAFTGRIGTAAGTAEQAELELGALRATAALGIETVAYEEGREHEGGTVTAARLHLRALRLESSGGPAEVEHLELSDVRVAWGDRGALVVDAGSFALQSATGELGGVRVTLASLRCAGLHVTRAETGAIDAELADVELEGLTLEVDRARLTIERARLAGRTRFRDGALSLDEVSLGVAKLAVEGLADGFSFAPSPAASPPAVRSFAPSPRADARTDWTFLDGVDGQLDVDLVVDATGLLVLRRVAIHCFRISIAQGTLNYRELERDLSLLEDMILDFAVRDGELVFEKKVPLVPLEGQALVTWPLDRDARELAARHLVRLRTLLGWQVPPSAPAWPGLKAFSFELKKLDFERIDARLSLARHGRIALGDLGAIRLGAPDRAALGALRVYGAVHHRESGASPPTELRLELEQLLVGLERVRVGALRLDAGEIAARALDDAVVTFHGVRPASLRCTLRDLVVRSLVIGPSPAR